MIYAFFPPALVTHDKNSPILSVNFVIFSKFIGLWNHHHNQIGDYLYHLQNSYEPPMYVLNPSLLPLITLICFPPL